MPFLTDATMAYKEGISGELHVLQSYQNLVA